MAEETIRFNIEYDIRGIDGTIRSSQRLLYFMNSIRLTITDFQRLLKDPSLENIFWTAIQLTTVWTNLIRLINQANRAAAGGTAINMLGLGGSIAGRAVASRTMGRMALGQTTLGFGAAGELGAVAARQGLMATLIGLAVSNPVTTAVMVGALLMGGGIMLQRQQQADWMQRQRDMAKTQGLEY